MIVALPVSKRLVSTDVPLAADNGSWMKLHAAAYRHGRHIGRKFHDAVQGVRASTTHPHVQDRLAHGDVPGTIGMVNWEHINREFPVHVSEHLRNAAHAAALTAQSQLSVPRDAPRGVQPPATRRHPSADFWTKAITSELLDLLEGDDDEDADLEFSFDLTNPRVAEQAAKHAAEMVTEITDETREALRELIQEAIREGLTIDQQGKLIRDYVGLTRRQMRALLNFRKGLIQQGRRLADVDRLSARQYQRSLNYRAAMIARTESLWALNAGQQELWRQAAEQGLFAGRTVKRKWITQAPGLSRGKNPTVVPCNICFSMRNQEVGLEEPFVDFQGNEHDQPGAHPLCVCAMGLVFGEPQQVEEAA